MSSGVVARPYWISFEVTQRCNLNCRHCRVEPIADLQEVPYSLALRWVGDLAQAGVLQINYSGGEPFLFQNMTDLLEATADNGMMVGITTNGWFVTDDICRRIGYIPTFQNFQVSLDSSTPAFHDWLRGVQGSWDVAVRAIKTATRYCRHVGVVMTVTRLNIHDVAATARLATELGVGSFGARRFFPTGKGKKNDDELSVTSSQYFQHLRVLDELSVHGNCSITINIEDPLMTIVNQHHNTASGFCPAGNTYGAITAAGDVRACIFLPVAFGNLSSIKFADIWDHSDIRKRLLRRERSGVCGTCDLKDTCGGCRAMAFIATGDPFGDDPTCWYSGR